MKKQNRNGNGEEIGEPTIEPEDFLKAFYILLVSVGGAYSFPAELLDKIDDNEKLLEVHSNEMDGRIYVKVIKKRKRRLIAKPKIILPRGR